MSEIKERPNKQALLRDLENIRASLSDENTELDIPVLTDTIFDDSDEEEEEEERYYDEKLIFDDLDEIEVLEDVVIDVVTDDDLDEEDVSEEELLRAAYRETMADRKVTESTQAPQALEGQQSLFETFDEFDFDDINETGIRQAIQDEESKLPMARGENPFLPAHIRERLTQGKNSFLEEIALVSASLNKTSSKSGKKPEPDEKKPEIIAPGYSANNAGKSAAKKNNAEIDHSKIVDELVASYLPRIEKELRTKLLQALKDKQK